MSKKNSLRKVPTFLFKLRQILEDPEAQQYIQWNDSNDSFQILNTTKLTSEVLPKYFKHSNLGSFIRQLNIYGFCRMKDGEKNSYGHPQFKKNLQTNLYLIQRKNLEKERSARQEKMELKELQRESEEIEYNCLYLMMLNDSLKREQGQLISQILQLKQNKQALHRKLFPIKQLSTSCSSTNVGNLHKNHESNYKSSFNLINQQNDFHLLNLVLRQFEVKVEEQDQWRRRK